MGLEDTVADDFRELLHDFHYRPQEYHGQVDQWNEEYHLTPIVSRSITSSKKFILIPESPDQIQRRLGNSRLQVDNFSIYRDHPRKTMNVLSFISLDGKEGKYVDIILSERGLILKYIGQYLTSFYADQEK